MVAETRRANDNYGSVLTAHPGSRRGGQLQTTGSQPIVSTACPTHVLPEAPVPEQAMTLTQAPDARTPHGNLHAPTTGDDHTAASATGRPALVSAS